MKTSAILVCLAAFAPTSAKEISPMTKAESYVVANDLLARRRVGPGAHPLPRTSRASRGLVDIGRRTRAPGRRARREISISARIA